ncbi:MAG: hypothetical protein ABI386_02705 [Rhodanobacter sp.]
MFKRICGALSSVITLAVLVVGIANAGVTNLERVVVTASTSDNFKVFLPVEFIPAARLQPLFDSVGEGEYYTDLNRSQVCEVLRQHPPQNCTISNYPAAPGIPSASGAEWAGNGCGTGPFTSAFVSAALELANLNTYSGDLNKPVKGNPSIDFTSICSEHDEHYTSGVTKAFADRGFQTRLNALCVGASSGGAACSTFANIYVNSVKNLGASAYEADQAQLRCAAWGDSMKKSGCV